jgi:hypothetical protein
MKYTLLRHDYQATLRALSGSVPLCPASSLGDIGRTYFNIDMRIKNLIHEGRQRAAASAAIMNFYSCYSFYPPHLPHYLSG